MRLLGDIETSRLVPEGQIWRISEGTSPTRMLVGPRTAWSLCHGGAWPGLSRRSRGVIERDRDRRIFDRGISEGADAMTAGGNVAGCDGPLADAERIEQVDG